MNKPSAIEVIGDVVELRRVGRRWRGLCPFHTEKTPSFFVDERSFHCFGCEAKGDVIDFVRMIEGISFKEAISRLGISDAEHKPKAIDKRKIRAAALLAGWMNAQHLKIGAMLREISRQISVAGQSPDPELVESLTRKWEILCGFFDDLQHPECAGELLEAKVGIESITANAPVEPLQEFPEWTPEYRKFLLVHLFGLGVGEC
jgi:DNA primase